MFTVCKWTKRAQAGVGSFLYKLGQLICVTIELAAALRH